eukprot:21000-Heterococcus_DN1.PRE.1
MLSFVERAFLVLLGDLPLPPIAIATIDSHNHSSSSSSGAVAVASQAQSDSGGGSSGSALCATTSTPSEITPDVSAAIGRVAGAYSRHSHWLQQSQSQHQQQHHQHQQHQHHGHAAQRTMRCDGLSMSCGDTALPHPAFTDDNALLLLVLCLFQAHDQTHQQQQPHSAVSDNLTFASGIASARKNAADSSGRSSARNRSHSVASSTTTASTPLLPYVPAASFEVADKPGALVKAGGLFDVNASSQHSGNSNISSDNVVTRSAISNINAVNTVKALLAPTIAATAYAALNADSNSTTAKASYSNSSSSSSRMQSRQSQPSAFSGSGSGSSGG